MPRPLKIVGILLAAALVLVVAAALVLSSKADARLARTHDVKPTPVAIAAASELERGQHLVQVLCTACHAADLGGGKMFEDPGLGIVDAPNLTTGKGGIFTALGREGFLRAIRHGVGRDGRTLIIMPARDFQALADEDVSAMLAAIEATPPVDRQTRPRSFTFICRVLIGLGAFDSAIAAEAITPTERPLPATPKDPIEKGRYLVQAISCRTCHGADLAGGKDPNPKAPEGPDLTSGGAPGRWSEAQFISVLRTGKTPEGKALNGDFMPWKTIGLAKDEELAAIYAYLKSQPSRPLATRSP
jgi:cytochrome c5